VGGNVITKASIHQGKIWKGGASHPFIRREWELYHTATHCAFSFLVRPKRSMPLLLFPFRRNAEATRWVEKKKTQAVYWRATKKKRPSVFCLTRGQRNSLEKGRNATVVGVSSDRSIETLCSGIENTTRIRRICPGCNAGGERL